MNKYKNAIILILILILLPLSIKFVKFMDTQRDVLGVLADKQVFQIVEYQPKIDINNIQEPKIGVKVPQDILDQMQAREQEKQAKIKAEQERIEKEKQLKAEQEKILLAKQKAETQVTSRGSTTTRVEETTDNSNWIKFTATAYCGCYQCCGKTTGRTASGTIATAGRTVAMPSSYKFGTKIQIQGM